jgi:metal-responsive CopG/Arc/MetJ family transcriptional regulator
MPTSVHLPKPLLDAVDRRARRLHLSRNRFIVSVLEKELGKETNWTPHFFDQLSTVTPGAAQAVDDMLSAIRAHRTRKAPPRL